VRLQNLDPLWPKKSVQHFLWMKVGTLIQLCGKWCWSCVVFQGHRKVQLLVFLFLAWFVVLQVIVEWLWRADFGDGAGSWLLNGQSLWAMWITILGDDWCWAFKGVKGCGQCKAIWSWLRRRKGGFFFCKWEKLSSYSAS